jgi:hypothetical protein
VTFSSTSGNITPTTANTDSSGIAVATLQANASADVTARSGAAEGKITVSLRPRSGLTLTGPATPPAAGLPASFTVAVAATANVTNVRIDFGDGVRRNLGALSGSTTIQHIYQVAGTFEVTATATQATGDEEAVGTAITILPAQPPSVLIVASDSTPLCGDTVTLTANVTGAVSTILSYSWDLGTGATPPTQSLPGNQVQVSWNPPGQKVVTVDVTQASGPTGRGQAIINVSAPCPP